MTKKIDKRQLIIDSAREILKTKNFQGMKTLEIAKKAKIAEGSLYKYFKNKDAIFVAIVEDFLTTFNNKVEATISEDYSIYKNMNLFIDNIYNALSLTGKDFYSLYLKAFSEIDKVEVHTIISTYTHDSIDILTKVLIWEFPNATRDQKIIFIDSIWGIIRGAAERELLNIQDLNRDSLESSVNHIIKMVHNLQEERNEKIV
ncbi:MAG: TetR/AcrR family transcriptional regulator [Psychrilyobacter sp.]|nr:TetR/AcrR family transcriptional regulator [Psychrilyobacter sp.]